MSACPFPVAFEAKRAASRGVSIPSLLRRLFGVVSGFLVALAAPALVAQNPAAPAPPRFVVVLDAAHGGDDPGARLGDQAEKDVTLALSVKLRSLLMARGIGVVTRESGADVNAPARAEIANHANAAACLTLHAALASGNNGPAVHLFVSSLSPTRDARPDSHSDARPDSRFVPWRTSQSAWSTRSTALAGELSSALSHAGISMTMGRTALPALDSMACPAVAVEIAVQHQANAQAAGGGNDADFEAQVLDALTVALMEWRSDAGQLGERRP
jgi:N-acetylmuramoyl-L-alanine amidase